VVAKSHYGFTAVMEMKYTSQHCCEKNNGRQNGLLSRMLFSE